MATFGEWAEQKKKKNLSVTEIAPVKVQEKEKTWLEPGAFKDGYQFGDVTKTILGTVGDIAEDASTGVLGMGEAFVDTMMFLSPFAAEPEYYQQGGVYHPRELQEHSKEVLDEMKRGNTAFVAKDLYNEEAIAKALISQPIKSVTGFDIEKSSVLGAKADSLAQSGGQLLATAGLQAVGVPWFLTTGVTSYGAEAENALRQGATKEEAGLSAAITAGAEILTEKLSGGISFGGKTLDDALTQQIAIGISNKAVRNGLKIGMDFVGEGSEEVISSVFSNLGSALYKDESISELLTSEEAIDEYIDSFFGGGILGGVSSTGKAVKSEAKGVDYVSGLTKNEKAVFDKVYNDAIAEREAEGKKLTQSEKTKLYDETMKALEKGYIDTDTIESTLGGESYDSYKAITEQESALKKEIETLENLPKEHITVKQSERLTEARQKLKELDLDTPKNQLSMEVSEIAKGDRLIESYNERTRRSQVFEADLTKYDKKQAEVVKKAMDSGILNNTNKTHDFVDMIAKISADTDISFDFTNNQRLKESGFAVDGKEVNGFVKDGNVSINIDSSKSLNSVVGHEITHVLEGTELYGELQKAVKEYSEMKGEYSKRLEAIRKIYEGVDGANVDAEITADLVGDYLFTDIDFISRLSTEKPNVFKRIFDEIKYLYKVATAGSKEARELEKVKRAFEKAYRESSKVTTETKNNESQDVKVLDNGIVTRYSISTWTPETQTKVRDILIKLGYEAERVDKWINDVNGVASVIASDKGRLDFEAADNQTMLKNNQEYVKTLDASTLCAKRLVYQGTFDAIQHRLPNTVLSSDDLIELQNMMKEHGVEAPCSVCYVESRRRHLGKFAQEWLDGYEGEYKPNLDEVTTSDGLENLRHTHPQTYKDFVDAMNKKGSSNPKVVQLRTEYRNEIMSLTPKQIENIEAIGGLRVQSFSDFETPHLLDMMQAVMDMSAKGLTSQAYTKVPNFAWVFGDTGIKINLSLIAEGNGFDSDGNLAFSSIEGMDINDAMALRDAYSENVGTIIVGANDKHILACMADNRIDFIIPFHRSGWGQKELDMMGMGSYKDYSYGQNEHSLETGKKVANLYPSDYWDYNLSGKENAERYLNLCARTGREPKFSDFLVDNGDGSYSLQPDGSTDGYWKTLIDFKMYDNDGNGVKQQKVQPNFNMEEAYRVLNEYEGGANKLPVAEDVVEEFVAKYNDGITSTFDAVTRYSLSDSEGNQLTEGQQEFFKESKVRDDEGNLMVVYHGSENYGFTVFDAQNSDDKTSFFFTNSEDMANSYVGDKSKLYKTYLNIKNPYIVDAKGHKWNNIRLGENSDDITGKVERYVDLAMQYDEAIDFGLISESLGDLSSSLEYMLRDEAENSDGESMFTDEEKEEMRQLASELDAVYDNWDEDSHRDEEGEPMDMRTYLHNNKLSTSYTTRQIARIAKRNGNDGVIIKNVYDNGKHHLDTGVQGFGNVYIAFGSNQIKSVNNENPTSDSDIRHSLSKDGEHPLRYGNYNVYGRDVALQEDIAPVQTQLEQVTERQRYSLDENSGMSEQTNTSEVAPLYEAQPNKGVTEGQLSMFNEAERDRLNVQNSGKKKDAKTKDNNGVAKILVEEPTVENKKSGFFSTFAELVLDKGFVFENLSKKTKNRNLEAKWNYIRYADGMAQEFIGNGTDGIRPLAEVQEEVKKAGLTEKLYEYVYHKHNIDRMSLENRYKDVTNKAVFGDSVTADVSREVVSRLESQYPALKKYANEIYAFNNYLRQMLVDGGVISKETADLWSEMYPNYVPIRRTGDVGLNINVPLDTGRTGINAPVKKAVGGSEDILPLFDTMAQRAFQTYKAVARNRFGVELKNTLGTTVETEATDVDGVIEGIESQDELLKEGKKGKNPTFTVFDKGEKVTFEITEEMYDALKPTNKNLAYTNKIANTISNLHRGVLTEYNPAFLARNAIKDAQDVLINSQHPAQTYKNFPKAIKEMATKGKWYAEYTKNGGEQNTYFDKETNTFAKEKSGLSKAIGVPLEAISRANNFIERLPRLAEYIASRESGRSIEESMLDAARVTTNFAAGGDLTKFANRNGATFLNASVQGVMQQVRNIREAKMNGFKGVAQLAAKYAVAGLPVLLLNSLLWDDDEDYEELSDYVKQSYYIIAKYDDGKFVRIPKGRMLAVIQSAFEQVASGITGNGVDLGALGEIVVSNLAPNNPIEDNILAPIIQVANNETWYGDDLVPTRLQDLPPGEQSDESTDSISKWLGEKMNISPYKINYLLDQYGGAIGDMVLPMLTPEAESGDDSILGNILAPVKDAFTTDSVMNNQNVSDFYDTSDELTMNANKAYATDEDVLANKYFNSVKTEVGKLYAEKREIQNSDLSDAEKYYLVRETQKKIDALAKEGLSEYEDVEIDGIHATVGDLQYRKTDSGWTKITDKQIDKQEDVTSGLGISASDYWNNKEEYDFAYEYPGKYAVSNLVGGYDKYIGYADAIGDFDAKDENGNTVSGLKKTRTKEYIFGLDLDYGQKAILYRTYYDSQKDKEEYDSVIKKYLNSRDDITYDDIVEIYKALGIQ